MADEDAKGTDARPRAKKAGKPEAERKAKPDELKLEKQADLDDEQGAREGDEDQTAPAAKRKGAKKAKKAAKVEEADKDAADDHDAGAEGDEDQPARKGRKGKARARPRPKLDTATARALKLRGEKNAQRPEFHRQEWFRYQRLGDKWRVPQGIQSKMRRHWRTHADVVSIGYRGPKAARGLHPSGFREVLVHNRAALEAVDPAREAVRIAGSVGKRKREEIQDDARKLGIRVLNWKVF